MVLRYHERSVKRLKRLGAFLKPFRRFQCNETGVTAVEFGLVALPFLALMMAIIEAGLTFFVGQVMDNGFRETSRLLRTGQYFTLAGSAGARATTLRDRLCTSINASGALFNCTGGGASNLKLEVAVLGSSDSAFSSGRTLALAYRPPAGNPSGKWVFDETGEFTNGIKFPAEPCGEQIVLVRAYYEWPSFTNLLGSSLSKLQSGNVLLVSTAAFRNEPFGSCA